MRKTYWDYLPQFLHTIGSLELGEFELETLFEAELFITGCLLADPEMDIMNAWSIMSGFDQPVIPASAQLSMIHRIRILFPNVRSRKTLESLMQRYLNLPEHSRLYHCNENGKWTPSSAKKFQKRLDFYKNIFTRPIGHRETERTFATVGDFHYYRRNHEGKPIPFKGIIRYVPEDNITLPEYRTKKHLTCELDKQGTRSTASPAIQEASATLARSHVNFQIHSLQSPPSKTFQYQGVQHVVGGLGAGKSTFMLQETVRLVKECGARIGFVEGSVSQVLKRVQELRREGINAVPVIGRSGRRNHLKVFMNSRRHRIDQISDWANEDHYEIKHLSDFCFIQALAGDDDEKGEYPCKSIRQEDQTNCLCPYASQCGIFRDFATLSEADVWVTTFASVLQTRIPIMLDPKERTIYEAMYDLLDVIFVDEADEVQKQFDSSFLTDYPLFGDTDTLFEKVYLESVQKTVGRYGKYSGDRYLQEWIDVLRRLEWTIRGGIYHKLYHSTEFARHLRGKMIRLSTWAHNLAEWFGDSEQQSKQIFKDLSAYADDPMNHPLAKITQELLETKENEVQHTTLKKVIKRWGVSGKNSLRRKYKYDWLTLYLFLGLVDHGLKEFMELSPLIQAKIGILSNVEGRFTSHQDFGPFIQEALTGPLTGFHYDVKDGKRTGTFKVAHYTGVGRYLLSEWNKLYMHADNKQGPSVVLLSGTSLAPDSAHYNLDIPVNWLLESGWSPPQITQEYYPQYDSDKNQSYISISGSDENDRSRNLEKLATKIFTKIEWELAEWRRKGTNRKVLLIVNSYDDVEDVHRAFQNHPEWKNRYRKLSRNIHSYSQDEFSRTELERFYEEDVDVLIAPMLAISRGYNILDESNSSLFGSVFFLVRPYPIPHDLTYLIQILHANLPQLFKEIRKNKLTYDKALKKIRSGSNKHFHRLYHKPDYWSILTPAERITIGWFTFVPVWQTIGRLLRNGTDARVFYCDAKFRARPNEQEGQSMLEIWEYMLSKLKNRREIQSLYGSFINNPIRNIKGE